MSIKVWHVTVREGSPHQVVRVAGQLFSGRGAVELNDADLQEPYRSEILNSEYLDVEVLEVQDLPEIDATNHARALALEQRIDLATVVGSGEEGRIVKSDVEAALRAARAPAGEEGAQLELAGEEG